MARQVHGADLFGERSRPQLEQEQQAAIRIGDGFQSEHDLFGEASSGDEEEEEGDEGAEGDNFVSTVLVEELPPAGSGQPGAVTQLLFLPVRVVSSGVSTAAALPTQVALYSGQKLAGAVSTSQALASSAIVASTGLVARTSMHVASGALSTAAFTANKLTGAVGTSVRTVSYVIPPAVSTAVWQGLGATGNVSASVISHAIAVPSYRMLQAIVPEVTVHFSEQDAVAKTKDMVMLLVKVLGPQNAFRVLKITYETINSEEAHDAFLLCKDVVREVLDGDNYRKAGTSISDATGVSTLAPVVKKVYKLLPSFDEMLDAISFVEDVSKEVTRSLKEKERESEDRFEVISSDSDTEDSSISTDAFDGPAKPENSEPDFTFDGDVELVCGVVSTDNDWVISSELSPDADISLHIAADVANAFVESGISFMSKVSDSDEVASLFNTLGDFLDVLIE